MSGIAKTFGPGLVEGMLGLAPGKWHGPISSGYGYHLVLVIDRVESRIPPLEEVREVVKREWVSAMRKAFNDDFVGQLRQKYTIKVDLPETDENRAEGDRK